MLAVRNLDKGNATPPTASPRPHPVPSVSVQELDLSSLESVRDAADATESPATTAIDLLINNAGVMMTPTRPPPRTASRPQFGTNHLGHFAFTGLLLDRVLARARLTRGDRQQHRPPLRAAIRFDDLQSDRNYNRVAAYGQSKLANLLFTYELAATTAGHHTIAVAAHPGGSNTELARNTRPVQRRDGRTSRR